LLHFVRRRVDVAVIEVGLGGRFDSTNVVDPLVSVITSVGLDHTAQLGDTLEAIAFQKAGIVKRRVPVVSGVTQPGPRAVVRRVAAELGCPVDELGDGVRFEYESLPPRVRVTTTRQTDWLSLRLMGRHQAANAALTVATVGRLVAAGLSVPPKAIAAGLATVVWPARVQVIGTAPMRVLDCAHNAPSAEALIDTLRGSLPTAGRKRCVFAVSNDKPYRQMLTILAGYFDEFVFTRYANNPRCVPPESLAGLVPTGRVMPTPAEAWHTAVAASGADDLVCATGSVFLAGDLTAALHTAE
jgi:dihydrofolate synthase/folylpolyglutamate synthase